MKKLFIVASLLVCICSKINAQCNDTIYPSGHDKLGHPTYYWPYNFRPATECELNFFRKFHPYLVSAFNKTQDYYKITNWDIRSPDPNKSEEDDISKIDGKGRSFNFSLKLNQGSEKTFFTLINSLGYFEWSFEMSSKELNTVVANYMTLVGKGTPSNDPGLTEVLMQWNDLDAKSKISLSIPNVNIQEDVLNTDNAKIELLPIKGAAYAIKIIRNKKIVDADKENNNNHLDELHIYIGKWKTPQITNTAALQKLVVQNDFNHAQPKLSLQNFMIVVKCDASLFDELIENINFEKLNKLIMQ